MEQVSHHDRETAYRLSDRGADGPTVLCIHGSGGSGGVWKAQARIADEYPVAALDLSGHGESDDVEAAAGYETLIAYADDVVAVAEAVDADVLCGNSLGGAVVLWIALQRDLDPEGIVLAGTGAKLSVLQDLLDWLAGDFDRAIEFLHGEDRLFHDPPDEYVELSEAQMRDTGRAVTERDFRTCHRFDVRDLIADIDTPALAVVGEHDKLTPPRFHDFFAEEMPNCRRALIEDAAHLAMLEQPTAFNAVLTEFLNAVDG